jgi:hypothetical protein
MILARTLKVTFVFSLHFQLVLLAAEKPPLPVYVSPLASFPLNIPRGGHAQLRQTPVIIDPPHSAYNDVASLASFDVACIAPEVIISSPLRTSGGNVFIFTKRLILKAAIDTRPYFRAGSVSHYGLPEEWPVYTREAVPGMAKVYNDNTVSVSTILKGAMAEFFYDYYTRSYEQIKTSNEVWLPELPAGITPPLINYNIANTPTNRPRDFPRNGVPSPRQSFDDSGIRSGNIVIAAEEILILKDQNPIRDAPDPFSCSHAENWAPPLLDARGVRGARGGLGQPGAEFANAEYGLNAPGSAGGPGGSIYLYRFGVKAGASDQELEAISRVSGGPPGSTIKIRVPLRSRGITTICATTPEAEAWPAAQAGDAGQFIIESVTEESMWLLAHRTARTLDAMFNYDRIELANRAEKDSNIISLTFEQHLKTRALQMLARSQAALVDATLALIGRPETAANEQNRDLWQTTITASPTQLPVPVSVALDELAILSSSNGPQAITHFLQSAGGILNIGATATINAELRFIREAMSGNEERVAAINSALRQLLQVQKDIDLRNVASDFDERIMSITTEINRIQEQYETSKRENERKYRKLMFNYAKAIVSFAAGAKGFESAKVAAGVFEIAKHDGKNVPEGKTKASRDKMKAADAQLQSVIIALGKSFLDLHNLHGISRPDTSSLERSLEQMVKFQNDFESAAQRTRIEGRSSADLALSVALSKSVNHESLIAKRVRHFPELYKVAWASLAMSYNGDSNNFAWNLSDLKAYVLQTDPAVFTFGDIDTGGQCRHLENVGSIPTQGWMVDNGCLYLAEHQPERIFYGSIDSGTIHISIPIIVARPFNSGVRMFNVRGLSDIRTSP